MVVDWTRLVVVIGCPSQVRFAGQAMYASYMGFLDY